MAHYEERTLAEQKIIRKAFEFEMYAIEHLCFKENPYMKDVKAMGLVRELWDAIELKREKPWVKVF